MRKEYIISGAVCALAMAFIFGFAGIFLLITGAGMGFYAWVTFHQVKLNQRAYEAEIKNREADAEFRHVVLSKVGILAYNSGELSFWSRREPQPDQRADALPEVPSAGPEAMPAAMPIIRDVIFLGLIGPQGTGKSTLLKHLIHSRAGEKQIIIDPHGLPEDYLGIRPYGLGRGYAEIDECFAMLITELDNRYNAGHYRHDRLNIYIDELTLLHKNCRNYKDFMGIMLTECRKINIRIVACMHSKRAKILGLEGSYDLVEGLRFFELKNENGRWWGELETKKGIVNLTLPGPFTESCNVNHVNQSEMRFKRTCEENLHGYAQETKQTEMPVYIEYMPGKAGLHDGCEPADPVHGMIVRMWRNQESLNSIARAVFGSAGGVQNRKIKEVLVRYGMI